MILLDQPRIGTWNPSHVLHPFTELGRYVGPPLPEKLVGQRYEQHLDEGTVVFRLGVLYRPDLPRRKPISYLERILILETGPAEMWDYDCWARS